jgi:hypothetical protein
MILLAICLLSGCSLLAPKPDAGTLARECMLLDRDTTYIVTKDMQKLECKR